VERDRRSAACPRRRPDESHQKIRLAALITSPRARRQVGRPSKAEGYREVLVQALTENPAVRSVELLHRARQAGYAGGKSALYTLAQTLQVRTVTPLVRFEGWLASNRSMTSAEVWVTYQDGAEEKVHFFGSRLKSSRWVEVTLVADERVETLVRAVEHLAAFGGIPLSHCLRSAEDDRAQLGSRWRGDRMESDVRWRRPRPRYRGRCAGRIARKRKAASRISSAG
jgi:hypothetical protein